jgi:hypothetical protein
LASQKHQQHQKSSALIERFNHMEMKGCCQHRMQIHVLEYFFFILHKKFHDYFHGHVNSRPRHVRGASHFFCDAAAAANCYICGISGEKFSLVVILIENNGKTERNKAQPTVHH